MYRTAPQIVFQFVGGFSIAQYAYPVLSKSFLEQSPADPSFTGTVKDSMSRTWGKVKSRQPVKTLIAPTTLTEDMESFLASYRVLSAAVLSLVLVSGGAPALIGAGISIYCDSTPEGTARYTKLKEKWHDFNK